MSNYPLNTATSVSQASATLTCSKAKLLAKVAPLAVFPVLEHGITILWLHISLELFVQYLATYSYRHGNGKERKALTYSDLSNTAEESETFQFLAALYF
ncbi:chromatin accessibility complex [Lynx pardinus]|uniref:Chromatin accessibility complex n=1 Tax=Lynx pardinus TaxID=191816 RepID=A0A485NK55_LYNPA|nr:chromatin accessibility complex [Lynx pardinus]